MLTVLNSLFLAATLSSNDTVQLGKIDFVPCELNQLHSSATTSAWCAPFEVPENRTLPDGRRISLKLALIRAESDSPQSDLVVLLAGGPGQAATEAYPAMAGALASLRRQHHILLLDQRGTGGSHALKCEQEKEATTGENAETLPDKEQIKVQIKRCIDKLDADPRYYTTSDAVFDLEAVRNQLGNPLLNLVGVSYGTRMAQSYLRAHTEGVRSMILDGVVPNEIALGNDFSVNLENALKLILEQCKKNLACIKQFSDPYKTLYTLRDRVRKNPLTISISDPQTFQSTKQTIDENTLTMIVRMFAYSAETAALLPLSLDQALQGNYAPLLGQSKLISSDLSASITGGMELSVICAEDADLLQTNPEQENTLLGNKLIEQIQIQCKIWPHGNRPADFHKPTQSDKPTLLLSGEFDPVTPPHYAEQVLKGLSNARHLVAKGQGHNVMPRGCLPRLAAKFIETLDPKNLQTDCLETLGPVPAFINFNGSTP